MPEDSEGRQELRWLLEPPEPGQIHFYLDVGDTTGLSAETRAAIERLVSALNETEVEGFQVFKPRPCNPRVYECLTKLECTTYNGCSPLSCWICGLAKLV